MFAQAKKSATRISSHISGRARTVLIVFAIAAVSFIASGWLYLQTATVSLEKSPVVTDAGASGIDVDSRRISFNFAVPYSRANQAELSRNPTPDQLAEAIRDSASYLLRMTNENGSFVYRENLLPEHKPSPHYNLLRHAGTLYALAQYQSCAADDAVRDAIINGARYLKTAAIAPVPSDPNLLAVWSREEITGDSGPVEAKLGGTGLALVALTSANRFAPNETPLDELRRLGSFLLYMQKDNGAFYSKYIPSKGGRYDKWASLYYPGEAALGLIMLYEQDPDPKWLDAAVRAMGFLAGERHEQDTVEADHWALLATRRILQLDESIELPVPRAKLVEHAAQICLSILVEKPVFDDGNLLHGGFASDGRTCPTATRLEGLIDALAFLPSPYDSLKQRIRVAVDDGIAFLWRAQIVSGEFAGGMPRSICNLPSGHPDASTSFNRRATEIRIDYVQHALSAMLAYQQLNATESSVVAHR